MLTSCCVSHAQVPENAEDVATIIKESWNTGGKSGAPLYFSADKKLVIKMLDEGEFSFLSEYSLKYWYVCYMWWWWLRVVAANMCRRM